MKNDRTCSGCIWVEQCETEEYACEYYDDGSEQPKTEEEALRKDFSRQWFEYIFREE